VFYGMCLLYNLIRAQNLLVIIGGAVGWPLVTMLPSSQCWCRRSLRKTVEVVDARSLLSLEVNRRPCAQMLGTLLWRYAVVAVAKSTTNDWLI